MATSLKDLKGNEPRANLEDYIFTLYGRGKVGKTSLFYKLVKKKYGDTSKGLLLAFERGYSALKGIYAQDIASWEDYIAVVDELVDERENLPFKLVAMDTVDIAYKMTCDFVVRREKVKDKKAYKDVSDIAYGAGYQMVADEFYKQLDRLVKIGMGVWFITHDKDKKFESRDGISYDQTTVNLPNKARDIIINASDFVVFIDNAKVTDGDGKLRDQRYIYFRAEGTDLEAGSRFGNIVSKIPYDEDLFLQAFEDAVLSEHGENVDIERIKNEQAEERQVNVREYVEQEKGQLSTDEMIAALNTKIKKLNAEQKKQVSNDFKGILGGTANYTTVTDPELLQQCLNAVLEITQ